MAASRDSFVHLHVHTEYSMLDGAARLKDLFSECSRMDMQLLSQYSKGIIATTGCPSGEVQTRILLGQYDQALAAAADFRDIFGPGNFFVELMEHGLELERRAADGLRRGATDLGL